MTQKQYVKHYFNRFRKIIFFCPQKKQNPRKTRHENTKTRNRLRKINFTGNHDHQINHKKNKTPEKHDTKPRHENNI